MAANYLILSLDGGGIRGLLTALILQRLQAELKVLDRVHLLAGTSTGGILALGLAKEKKIDDLVALYRSRGERIFVPFELDGFRGKILNPLFSLADGALHRVDRIKECGASCKHLAYARYSNQGLLKEVQSVFGFGTTLKTLAKQVLVTTFRLDPKEEEGWTPAALHNLPTPGNDPDQTHVVEAAMCTSAAPVYFPPYKHGKLGWCVDGGIFANSPGAVALATAISARVDPGSVRLLTVGTGRTVNRLAVRDPEELGVADWLSPFARGQAPALPLVSAFFEATSLADAFVCQQFLKEGDRFRRIQINMTQPVGLDDYQKTDQLEKMAQDYFKTPQWTEHLKWVKEKFV